MIEGQNQNKNLLAPTTKLSYVEGNLGLNDHLLFSFQSSPHPDSISKIATHFTRALNAMDTGSQFITFDNTRSTGGVEFKEYQIKKKHPKISDLDKTCYTVNQSSLDGSIRISLSGRKGFNDDEEIALRTYQALLETTS